MEIIAKTPEDIAPAYSRYYSLLADVFIRLIPPIRPRIVLEAGCGEGQLTLPLLRSLPAKSKIIGVDSSRGSYVGWLDELRFKVNQAGLGDRIRLVNADVRNIKNVKPASVDVIVSNELICDLTREHELAGAFNEFRRLLRPGGKMIHGEWSSQSQENSQGLRIKHWPTWNPDQIFRQLRRLHFHNVKVTYFETTIKFGYEAAVQELRTLGATPEVIRRHAGAIKKNGICLPFEHIIECRG